jgi:cell shape-determining protein MreC
MSGSKRSGETEYPEFIQIRPKIVRENVYVTVTPEQQKQLSGIVESDEPTTVELGDLALENIKLKAMLTRLEKIQKLREENSELREDIAELELSLKSKLT